MAAKLTLVMLLLLAACRATKSANWRDRRITEQERALAERQTSELRETLKAGACEAIYAESSAYFRRGPLRAWLLQCELLREKLGEWQTFDEKQITACGQLCVEVMAFRKEGYSLTVQWIVESGHARLASIYLRHKGEFDESFPRMPGRHIDPLIIPPRGIVGLVTARPAAAPFHAECRQDS